jgi:hypothetical protein
MKMSRREIDDDPYSRPKVTYAPSPIEVLSSDEEKEQNDRFMELHENFDPVAYNIRYTNQKKIDQQKWEEPWDQTQPFRYESPDEAKIQASLQELRADEVPSAYDTALGRLPINPTRSQIHLVCEELNVSPRQVEGWVQMRRDYFEDIRRRET